MPNISHADKSNYLKIEYSAESVRHALKNLHYPKKLGRHEYANLDIVSKLLQRSNGSDSTQSRGLALASFLEGLINRGMADKSYKLLDWKILYEIALEGKSLGGLAQELKFSKRSMSRYYLRACYMLAREIMNIEREAHDSEVSKHVPVPPPPDELFVGRAEELKTILSALLDRESIFIFGMPGVGKTSLAKKILSYREIREHFENGILWLNNCNSTEVIIDTLFRFFAPDHIFTDYSLQEKISLLRASLIYKKVLLVLDNMDDQSIANDMTGSLLIPVMITSRKRLVIPRSKAIELTSLSTHEAMDLFVANAGQSLDDTQLVQEICELLGNLPLALIIAASRLRKDDFTCRQLVHLLLRKKGPLAGVSPGNAAGPESSVSLSFDASFRTLDEKSQNVFFKCATLSNVRRFTLEDCAEACGLSDDEALDVLGRLVEVSILVSSDGGYAIHPLLREYAITKLGQHMGRAIKTI